MNFRNFSISILVFIIISIGSVQAKSESETDTGYVVLVEENRVYIDKGFTDGVRVGAVFSVYNGEERARIKVVETFEEGSSTKILTPYVQVEIGDQVKPYVKSTPSIHQPIDHSKKSSKVWAWLSLSVGLASGSGTAYCHWRAGNSSSHREQYNRGKWFLAGTSGVALATSLFLFIHDSSDNQPVSFGRFTKENTATVSGAGSPVPYLGMTTNGSIYVSFFNHTF